MSHSKGPDHVDGWLGVAKKTFQGAAPLVNRLSTYLLNKYPYMTFASTAYLTIQVYIKKSSWSINQSITLPQRSQHSSPRSDQAPDKTSVIIIRPKATVNNHEIHRNIPKQSKSSLPRKDLWSNTHLSCDPCVHLKHVSNSGLKVCSRIITLQN